MTLQIRIPAAFLCLLFATHASAADNASLVNRPVRVQVNGLTTAPVPGKLVGIEGCLYVQFDQKQGSITSVRLDQVTNLQITGGGANPPLQTILSQEPRKCFVEAAG